MGTRERGPKICLKSPSDAQTSALQVCGPHSEGVGRGKKQMEISEWKKITSVGVF